ncbi:MAG: Flp family type IVb pilin [Acetobacteraceae bacterium]
MPRITMPARALLADRRAVTALEYGLIGSILIGVILLGYQVLGDTLANEFTSIGAGL